MILTQMQPSHVDGVKELLDGCFGSSAWSRASIVSQLEKNVSRCAVALDGDRVVGYTAFEVIADEGSLVELAVAPEYRRRGVGRQLIRRMLASCDGVRTVYLEVRASNLPALSLYRSMGFREIAVRRDYYADPKEDAVMMEYQRDERRSSLLSTTN